MKVAIYSGSIPSSTFIEKLIQGIANEHTVYLFGTIKSDVNYKSKNIHIVETPTNQFWNILLTLKRVLFLIYKEPRLLVVAIKEARKYSSLYEQWMRFTRFIPVLLYQPDIFHLQWASKISRWMFLKEAYNCKLVVSLRGAHINYSPIANMNLAEIYRVNFPFVDRFHAVSEAIKKEAQKYEASPNKIKVIHSLIEKDTFLKYKIYTKSNPKRIIRLCCVGRFHWKKGYDYILKACSLLKKYGVNFELTIIASNSVTEDILYYIHDLGLTEKVILREGLSQEPLFTTMQTFDVFVLPSVEEGIANVVLEAMAIGIPVISTDCGGMSEVVIHKETGWLVPVRDPFTLADTVMEVINTSQEELQRITQNAHEFIKAHFNAEDSIQQFLEFYDEVMA